MIIASTQPHTEGGRRMDAASNTELVAMARNGDLFFSFDPNAKHLETERCPAPSLMMQDPPAEARSVAWSDGRDFSRKQRTISEKNPLRGAPFPTHPVL